MTVKAVRAAGRFCSLAPEEGCASRPPSLPMKFYGRPGNESVMTERAPGTGIPILCCRIIPRLVASAAVFLRSSKQPPPAGCSESPGSMAGLSASLRTGLKGRRQAAGDGPVSYLPPMASQREWRPSAAGHLSEAKKRNGPGSKARTVARLTASGR